MFTASAGIVIKQWPDEPCAVVYAPLLRTTHLISSASARLLQTLDAQERPLQDLALDWVSGNLDEAPEAAELMVEFRDALAALEGAELISSSL